MTSAQCAWCADIAARVSSSASALDLIDTNGSLDVGVHVEQPSDLTSCEVLCTFAPSVDTQSFSLISTARVVEIYNGDEYIGSVSGRAYGRPVGGPCDVPLFVVAGPLLGQPRQLRLRLLQLTKLVCTHSDNDRKCIVLCSLNFQHTSMAVASQPTSALLMAARSPAGPGLSASMGPMPSMLPVINVAMVAQTRSLLKKN